SVTSLAACKGVDPAGFYVFRAPPPRRRRDQHCKSFDSEEPTMSDIYSETTRTDWTTRIAASIKGIGAGIILASLASCGLFRSEGSAVHLAKSLAEGAGLVVNIDVARLDPTNESKLIHVTGEIKAGIQPNDTEF